MFVHKVKSKSKLKPQSSFDSSQSPLQAQSGDPISSPPPSQTTDEDLPNHLLQVSLEGSFSSGAVGEDDQWKAIIQPTLSAAEEPQSYTQITEQRKQRKSRYSETELYILARRCVENMSLINSIGCTNADINAAKSTLWDSILAEINANSTCERTVGEIRRKWQVLKSIVKRKEQIRRQEGLSLDDYAEELQPLEKLILSGISEDELASWRSEDEPNNGAASSWSQRTSTSQSLLKAESYPEYHRADSDMSGPVYPSLLSDLNLSDDFSEEFEDRRKPLETPTDCSMSSNVTVPEVVENVPAEEFKGPRPPKMNKISSRSIRNEIAAGLMPFSSASLESLSTTPISLSSTIRGADDLKPQPSNALSAAAAFNHFPSSSSSIKSTRKPVSQLDMMPSVIDRSQVVVASSNNNCIRSRESNPPTRTSAGGSKRTSNGSLIRTVPGHSVSLSNGEGPHSDSNQFLKPLNLSSTYSCNPTETTHPLVNGFAEADNYEEDETELLVDIQGTSKGHSHTTPQMILDKQYQLLQIKVAYYSKKLELLNQQSSQHTA